MALAQAALRRSGVLGSSASEVKHLFRERLPSPRLTSPRLNLLSQRLHDAARRFHITSLICSGLGRGSELRGLSTERKATKHYGSLTSLLRQMGESTLPAIVMPAALPISSFPFSPSLLPLLSLHSLFRSLSPPPTLARSPAFPPHLILCPARSHRPLLTVT